MYLPILIDKLFLVTIFRTRSADPAATQCHLLCYDEVCQAQRTGTRHGWVGKLSLFSLRLLELGTAGESIGARGNSFRQMGEMESVIE